MQNKSRFIATGILVASVFTISFQHIMAIAHSHGNGWTSFLYPMSIDGLIVACTMTLITKTGVSKVTRKWAGAGRYFGFAATCYANAVHSGWSDTDTVIINLIPAIALIIGVEVLVHAAQGTTASRSRRAPAKRTGGRVLKLAK